MTQGNNRFKINYMRSMETISFSSVNANNLNQILFSNLRRTPSSLTRITRFATNTNDETNRLIALRNKKTNNYSIIPKNINSVKNKIKNQEIEDLTNIPSEVTHTGHLTNLVSESTITIEDQNNENNEAIDTFLPKEDKNEDSEIFPAKKINTVEFVVEEYSTSSTFKIDSDTENSENDENDENDFIDEYWNDENKN
jgi:hypothetical protein